MALSLAAGVPDLSGLNQVALLSKKYRTYFRRSLVLMQISNTNPQAMAKGIGDTIRVPILPTIVGSATPVGTEHNWDCLTPTSIDLVIDKHWEWCFADLDAHKAQSQISAYAQQWSQHAAKNTKEGIETAVFADIIDDCDAHNLGATAGVSHTYNLGTAAAPRTVTSTSTNDIVDAILECGAVLDEQDAPDDGRYFVTNPWGYTKMKSALRNANEMGDNTSVLRSGLVGEIDRFKVYVCNRLPANSAVDSKPVFTNIFGQKEALAFHIQMDDIEKVRLTTVKGDGYRSELLFGYKMLHPTAMGVTYWTPSA